MNKQMISQNGSRSHQKNTQRKSFHTQKHTKHKKYTWKKKLEIFPLYDVLASEAIVIYNFL